MLRTMFIEFLKVLLVFAALIAIFTGVRLVLYGMQSLYDPDYLRVAGTMLLVGTAFSVFYGVFVAIYNRLMNTH
jgi:hypothetical protein